MWEGGVSVLGVFGDGRDGLGEMREGRMWLTFPDAPCWLPLWDPFMKPPPPAPPWAL